MVRSRDLKQVNNSQKLSLGNVPAICDIEVLEAWFQMDSLVHNCRAVLIQKCVNLVITLTSTEVLSAGKQGIVPHDWGHSHLWSLINSCNCEGLVYARNECFVVEKFFWIIGLILLAKCIILIISQYKSEL